ncbi:unnamed protein product [Phaeothamnion confervicola]
MIATAPAAAAAVALAAVVGQPLAPPPSSGEAGGEVDCKDGVKAGVGKAEPLPCEALTAAAAGGGSIAGGTSADDYPIDADLVDRLERLGAPPPLTSIPVLGRSSSSGGSSSRGVGWGAGGGSVGGGGSGSGVGADRGGGAAGGASDASVRAGGGSRTWESARRLGPRGNGGSKLECLLRLLETLAVNDWTTRFTRIDGRTRFTNEEVEVDACADAKVVVLATDAAPLRAAACVLAILGRETVYGHWHPVAHASAPQDCAVAISSGCGSCGSSSADAAAVAVAAAVTGGAEDVLPSYAAGADGADGGAGDHDRSPVVLLSMCPGCSCPEVLDSATGVRFDTAGLRACIVVFLDSCFGMDVTAAAAAARSQADIDGGSSDLSSGGSNGGGGGGSCDGDLFIFQLESRDTPSFERVFSSATPRDRRRDRARARGAPRLAQAGVKDCDGAGVGRGRPWSSSRAQLTQPPEMYHRCTGSGSQSGCSGGGGGSQSGGGSVSEDGKCGGGGSGSRGASASGSGSGAIGGASGGASSSASATDSGNGGVSGTGGVNGRNNVGPYR